MKREVYVCDNEGCGAVMLNPEDGFVLKGVLLDAGTGMKEKILLGTESTVGDAPPPDGSGHGVALCRGCMKNLIDHQPSPTETPVPTVGQYPKEPSGG